MAGHDGGFTVQAHDYSRIGAALHRQAAGGIQKELTKALRDAGKPFGKYVLVAGAAKLPRKGGLSYRVASGSVTIQASTLRTVVTLRTPQGDALQAIDKGIVRHPVYGRRKTWVTQHVPVGVFSTPFNNDRHIMQKALLDAGHRVIANMKAGA